MKKPSPQDEYFKAAFSEIEIVRDNTSTSYRYVAQYDDGFQARAR
jgi:hypothetical protein